jgi:hypothetical protein
MAREIPTSTPEKLFIDADWQTFGLDELIERAQDHFNFDETDPGRIAGLIQIEQERIQTSGCYCHPDSSDFTTYFIITKKDI